MTKWVRAVCAIVALVGVVVIAVPAQASGARSTYNAMWLSIAHPGLGSGT